MSASALSFLPVFIFPLGLLSVGGIHAVQGFLLFLRHRRLAQFATYTSGTVLDVRGAGNENALFWILKLRVQFKTQMGQDVEFKEVLYTREKYASGHWVPV
ncbi:MAG: hypothetical protein M3362_21490, partial [Acidobacteriota bacterium]|nr:hypothetical protein [Acidobacteriota bacterium]